MTEFTPVASALGGALIGLSAVILMAANGRIAGITGILGNLVQPLGGALALSSAAFIAGLMAAPAVYTAVTRETVNQSVSGNIPLMIGAGLLVGVGTAVSGGCTSGHGVCGLARFSVRSLVAVLTFMAAAFVTVYVVRHALGG